MSDATTALFGATLGGAASLAGVAVSSYVSGRVESRRQRAVQSLATIERLRLQTADALRLMLHVEYLIYSVCWTARYLPDQLDDRRASSYDSKMSNYCPSCREL